MLRTKLLDSSTFRLTVVYLGLFSLSALAILAGVYLAAARYMDRQARDVIRTDAIELSNEYASRGYGWLVETVRQRANLEKRLKNIYGLYDPVTLRQLAGNLPLGTDLPLPDDGDFVHLVIPVQGANGTTEYHEALAQIGRVLVGQRDVAAYLVVGRDLQDKANTLRTLQVAIGIGFGAMLVLGVAGGYIMSRWMLHRLDVVNRTTARIMAGDLSRRIEVGGTADEFDELGRNVNAMLDRIDRLLSSMRQVTDDIAHDLRTPLTRLRSRIEVGMMRELAPAEARELLEATIRDADKLIETFNALLSIARAESGAQRSEWEMMDLSALVHEVSELYEPLAEEKGIELTVSTPGPVLTPCNRQLVAQAVANLADNAVKYTPAGGKVWLRTQSLPTPRVEVADSGPGIPAEERERAKERFVRLDATRTTPGSGLGLSLVDAVAKLHEAKLELLDNAPGLKVQLTFPALPAGGVERAPQPAAERAGAFAHPLAPAERSGV